MGERYSRRMAGRTASQARMMLRLLFVVTVDRNGWEAQGAWFQALRVTVLRFLPFKIMEVIIGKRRGYRLIMLFL
jgi:hypothetical protein